MQYYSTYLFKTPNASDAIRESLVCLRFESEVRFLRLQYYFKHLTVAPASLDSYFVIENSKCLRGFWISQTHEFD